MGTIIESTENSSICLTREMTRRAVDEMSIGLLDRRSNLDHARLAQLSSRLIDDCLLIS
jgi:hypothetical protein